MEIDLDTIKQYYKLSAQELEEIQNRIITEMLAGKTPVQSPKAIFTIAPPGSGKTGLNGYSMLEIPHYNVIIINNDELKPRHPKASEVARLYPDHYTKIINEASIVWTDALMEHSLSGRYNVIYEGTGRGLRILLRMISKMKELGYEIIVRAMAVSELNCLMAIVERYEHQLKETGWGRIVSLATFNKAYHDEMLDTVDFLEKMPEISTVEVYERGETPTTPRKIYESNDPHNRFPSAKMAVMSGRLADQKNAVEYFKTFHIRMIQLLKNNELTQEERNILRQIQQVYSELNNAIPKDTGER